MKNSILAEITFGPYPDDAESSWCNEVDRAVSWFSCCLARCGQIYGEGMQAVVAGELKAYLQLTALDALDEKHASKYVRENLEKLHSLFGRAPEIRLLTPEAQAEPLPDWRQSEWLVLYGSDICALAPVINQDGLNIPTYLLPIDANGMEGLYFWARSQERHYHIWLASASLEMETYVALADPKSRLNADALELTEQLEKATGKPVYRYLFRHYALPGEAELNRACPGCGMDWRKENENHDFRCEPCRLISDTGVAEDENVGRAWAANTHNI